MLSALLLAGVPGLQAAPPKLDDKIVTVSAGFDNNTSDWTLFVPGESTDKHCEFTVSQDEPHTGTGCAKLSSPDFARYSISPKGSVAIAPGEHWRVVVWLRAAPGSQAQKSTPGFVIRFPLYKDKEEVTGSYSIYVGVNGKSSVQSPADGLDFSMISTGLPPAWTKIESVFEIPRTLGDINLMYGPGLFSWNSKGVLYVDDVVL